MHLKQRWQKLGGREKRLLFYLLILLGFTAWKFTPRYWKPTVTIQTQHYVIASTATHGQTEEIGRVVEILYNTYSNRFGTLPTFSTNHPKLQLILYKDPAEFRRINPGRGWAEAFYKKPYCRAYYSVGESNPYHWMLHEAVHQLNEEVAHLKLMKWLEEGSAEYFSTSRFQSNRLVLGTIDPDAYPVWWHDEIAKEPDLQNNLQNGSVIPLRAIITDRGGPRLNSHVNLYYLHWWTLTHFVFERHGEKATELIKTGGSIGSFEKIFKNVETIQPDWHSHVRRIKAALNGNDLHFSTTGQLPAVETNGPEAK